MQIARHITVFRRFVELGGSEGKRNGQSPGITDREERVRLAEFLADTGRQGRGQCLESQSKLEQNEFDAFGNWASLPKGAA